MKVRRRFAALALVAGLLAGGAQAGTAGQRLRVETATGARELVVEVVRDRAGWARGLAGRPGLGPDEGMLFLYPLDRTPHIWMRGMRFPIDVVFVAADGRVVATARSLVPGSTRTVSPPRPVRATLEVAAGTVDRLAIGPGTRLAGAGLPATGPP